MNSVLRLLYLQNEIALGVMFCLCMCGMYVRMVVFYMSISLDVAITILIAIIC